MKYLNYVIAVLTIVFVQGVSAEDYCGKVDIGPAYVHIDILESGKTIQRMDMAAIRGDANILLVKGYGFVFKPVLLYGKNRGDIFNASLGFGHCTPLNRWLTVTPSFGVAFTNMHTRIELPVIGKVKESLRSVAPFVALEATVRLSQCWRISALYQYAWSQTRTVIKRLLNDKSHSYGASYSLQLEHDLYDNLSVNIGAAYNLTLTKEKHGLRAVGVKVGVAYWF